MKLSSKDRQRYAHILPLLEKEKSQKENKLVVKYSLGAYLIPIISTCFLIFMGCSLLSLYLEDGDKVDLWFGVLILGLSLSLMAWFIRCLYWPTLAVIDKKGVYFAKQKRMVPLEDIQFLSIDVEDYGWITRNHKRIRLWCYLNDGDELDVELTNSNYGPQDLYKEITSNFPQIKCYPPD